MSDNVACDARNRPIAEGDYVKYAGTHTRGRVKEIRTDGDRKWVLIDSTDLYYDPKHLELATEVAEAADKEVQSLDEFRKRLDHKRESMRTAMESFDEPGG